MKLHQSTHNRFKGKLLKQLKEEVDSLRLGSRSRRIALDKYNKYKEESNTTYTVSEALKEVHCKAVPVASDHINCAFNRCQRCPKFKQPSLEKSCEDFISIQNFEVVNYCTEHLVGLPTGGATICFIYNAWDDGEKKGTVKLKRQLVHKSLPFQQFFKKYYTKNVLKFKRQKFLYIILSKNLLVGMVNQLCCHKCIHMVISLSV